MVGPVVVSRENLQKIYSSGDVHCHPLVGRGGFFGLSVELRRPASTPYGRSRERRPSELVGSGSEARRTASGDQADWKSQPPHR